MDRSSAGTKADSDASRRSPTLLSRQFDRVRRVVIPVFVSAGLRLVAFLRRLLCGRMALPVAGALGVVCGLIGLLFHVSNAASYLSDSPKACINCHVMNSYYAGWRYGSHRGRATCNDCHVPQGNKLRGMAFKAMDGLRHAAVFTTRTEPQVIRLNSLARRVIQQNCVRCHATQVMNTPMGRHSAKRRCWDCHRHTPHGRSNSLSSSPNLRRPSLPAAGL